MSAVTISISHIKNKVNPFYSFERNKILCASEIVPTDGSAGIFSSDQSALTAFTASSSQFPLNASIEPLSHAAVISGATGIFPSSGTL